MLSCLLLAALSVWDYPRLQPQHERLRAELVQSIRAGDVEKMEKTCRRGTELLPSDPVWAYNLACALTRQGGGDAALDQLEKAIDLGFREPKTIASDGDLKRLAGQRRFKELVEYAQESRGRPILFGPLAVANASCAAGGYVALGSQNLVWDFDDACFSARLTLLPGQAGGNAGDLYVNRDAGHSALAVTNYPGLTEVRFDREGRERGMDLDFPNTKFPYPVFGNCSRAYVHDLYWRSIPRAMMTTAPRQLQTMTSLYLDNQVWVFPANADFPPVGTNGDVFASVAPYWLTTQGRSWSDQYYLKAALEASRSFDPQVKREIVARRLLAPTIMTLVRKSLKGVDGEEGYLTAKAHPTCLPPDGLDLAKLKALARGMRVETLPPLVRIRRLEAPASDKPPLPELTYFTPFAAAVLLRLDDATRTLTIAADGADEIAFRIVHDPLSAAKIAAREGDGVSVTVDRARLSGTARVDIAAFGRNAKTGWGAPAYVSVAAFNPDASYCDPVLAGRELSP